jgi:hypothetical protein
VTEKEWLTCTELLAMMKYLRRSRRRRSNDRKLRLFACADLRWAHLFRCDAHPATLGFNWEGC